MNEKPFRERRLLQTLCICYGIIWIGAAIYPLKPDDWLLENLLVFVSVPLLVLTYDRLPFSNAFYLLVFLFLILHAAGAHYTYSEVPFGYWLEDTFHLRRNHFDRIVHFSFGLLLTYPVHEILVRVVRVRGYWALLLAVPVIVSLSGFLEIVEAVVAWLVDPDLGAAYLGIQGDVWDAQKDMALAVLGAVLAVGLSVLQGTSWSGRPSSR